MQNLIINFSKILLQWYAQNGRKNLPWQHPYSAYRIWIAEIMLQQTQVQTVIPYFNRFMEKFPSLEALSVAPEDDVLALWSGLGYYSRARNIYKTAQILIKNYQGQFPQQLEELVKLPGIGQSTAAAILSQAFNLPTAILDGNVTRVLSRYFMISGLLNTSKVKSQLWELAQACMPQQYCADYTQAIMDFGAICCTKHQPNCSHCPFNQTCLAYLHQQVHLLPTKKMVKKIPTKKQKFLLIYNQDRQIFLEKRPAVGIWGSLWSLPIIEWEDNENHILTYQFGFECLNSSPLLTIKHSFTHYKLDILAIALLVVPHSQVRENNGQWYDTCNMHQLGLPKPVKTIIDYFFSQVE